MHSIFIEYIYIYIFKKKSKYCWLTILLTLGTVPSAVQNLRNVWAKARCISSACHGGNRLINKLINIQGTRLRSSKTAQKKKFDFNFTAKNVPKHFPFKKKCYHCMSPFPPNFKCQLHPCSHKISDKLIYWKFAKLICGIIYCVLRKYLWRLVKLFQFLKWESYVHFRWMPDESPTDKSPKALFLFFF